MAFEAWKAVDGKSGTNKATIRFYEDKKQFFL
jgi:hypothetical protein